ncbi:MAG: metallophosphoesterase [Lachnospiraceae bacterium]|nr:metallophosphoesterase [Clostridiaceae bacterium]MDY3826135.1 metallophosphoesterase [Lachnospiraceae bacterium]RHU83436.1 metallophosphoesterase [Clostridiaceae bacterium OM08-6BH]
MKVLIVSDTHGREQNLAEALEQTGPIDQLIHLGDVEGGAEHIRELAGDAPAAIIAGNNDFFCDLPNERIFTLGGHRIFMTHGHGYFVHSGTLYLKREARKKGADIVMFGHTHKPYMEEDNELLVLNPGSLSLPRQEGHRPTYIVMEIADDGQISYELCYL